MIQQAESGATYIDIAIKGEADGGIGVRGGRGIANGVVMYVHTVVLCNLRYLPVHQTPSYLSGTFPSIPSARSIVDHPKTHPVSHT